MVTKGNFRKYFCYKLSKNKRPIIFFGLLNFMAVLLPPIVMSINYRGLIRMINVEEKNEYGIVNVIDFSGLVLSLIMLAVLISIVMIVATTANSLRLYHNRAEMDTLGCLPISYKQRFWGDFLSCITANFISFVPFYLISLLVTEDMKKPIFSVLDGYLNYNSYSFLPLVFRKIGITLILVYLGIYAVTAFVCSCCGKKRSSVLYTFVTMTVLPGIYIIYGNHLFSYVLGMDAFYEVAKNVSMLPPLGPIISLIMTGFIRESNYFMWSQELRYSMLIDRPFYVMIFLLIIAAFIVGAYFIGKRRRAEKVGESFVFTSAYHALTLTFLVTLIGASAVSYSNIMDDSGVIWVMLFSFIVYAALEILQNKGFKGFWKTAVRFAGVFGICFAFLTLVKTTDAFGLYKVLPSESSIKEVRVSGKYFYTPFFYNDYEKKYVLDTSESFSGILNEHKNLIGSDGLRTGDEIKIVYVLKSGMEITRQYSVKNADSGDAVKSFSDAVKQLPDFDFGDLGVIDKPDLDKYIMAFSKTGTTRRYVRSEKLKDFAEVLRNDIKNNYSNTGGFRQDTYGHMMITEKGKKHDFANDYDIFPSYEDTIAFLNDPENVTTETIKNDSDTYILSYSRINMSLLVSVSTEDTSDTAKKLLSYIKPKSDSNSYDNLKGVYISGRTSGMNYTIDAADEEAVLKLMIALFLEQHMN